MRITLLIPTLLCLALAACGESVGTWTKQGGAPYQSVSAQKRCLQQANQLNFLNTHGGPRAGSSAADSGSARNNRNDMYRMCMADHGYSKVRVTDDDAGKTE
ncbi:MAG: hypothetical protein HOH66_15275 [Rhodospirillaceae bacterium]|jgi:hypothetical protein|nr:hypothetical protein [Rhodospirillaceae bacterium]MBT6119222.1 hypothetical protein [Rhodospirillaceae bacterium]